MAFPSPIFSRAHSVLQFASPVLRDPGRDEAFISAVKSQFPNVVSRQYLPANTPAITPNLVLASTSSQLALSAIQADFEVRFYGEYETDFDRALDYIEVKVSAVRQGLEAVDVSVASVGVIAGLAFSFTDQRESPVAHILSTHLRTELDPDETQDAFARVAVKVRDTYFMNLQISNYESRVVERPMMAGINQMVVRPWEGKLDDVGIELVIDINNNLEARTLGELPRVTDQGISAVMNLLKEAATGAGPAFVQTGEISVEALTEASTR